MGSAVHEKQKSPEPLCRCWKFWRRKQTVLQLPKDVAKGSKKEITDVTIFLFPNFSSLYSQIFPKIFSLSK